MLAVLFTFTDALFASGAGLIVFALLAAVANFEVRHPEFDPQNKTRVGYRTNQGRNLPPREEAK